MDFLIEVLDKPLAELLAKDNGSIVFEYPIEKIWNPNGISLKRRVLEDPSFLDKVNKTLDSSNLKQYIMPVDPAAPTRCIDGRCTHGWEDFDQEHKTHLGPKIAGGTAHAALAHRIVDVDNLTKDLLFEHDIEYVVNRYKEIGIGFGGHADTHQRGWNTGCGAVDNINLILERLQRPEPQEQLRGLTKMLLGEAYDGRHIANEIIGRMLFLDALKPSYMPKEGGRPEGEFLYKKKVIDLLRSESKSAHEPVPELAGEHAEVAIVFNFVEGTTIDTDRFNYDNDGEIQIFGWDVWEIYEEAARLYPYDMHVSPANQQEAITKREQHVTTRALLGISTAMVLTDGSLKAVTVKESAPAAA
jgi:hypothetical protein